MQTPSADIIVPVWNNPFETRACLAAILEHSPDARLIIVDNGSSRETELMLEEFSEPLGEHGLFIKSERNVGLVPAINIGLARSDSEFAVIVRPHVMVNPGWLKILCDTAVHSGAGIVSPQFSGTGAPRIPRLVAGCTEMESGTVSWAALLLRGEMRVMTGLFDERMDGAEWCLREYVRRAASKGYRTVITSRAVLACGTEQMFGSAERRHEMQHASRGAYLAAWGDSRNYLVYFGKNAEAGNLDATMDSILDGARQGHHFTLLLHRRQYSDFRRLGWNGLHTGIELSPLSLFFPQRDMQRTLRALQATSPGLVTVRGGGDILFPGAEAALPLEELLASLQTRTTRVSHQNAEVLP